MRGVDDDDEDGGAMTMAMMGMGWCRAERANKVGVRSNRSTSTPESSGTVNQGKLCSAVQRSSSQQLTAKKRKFEVKREARCQIRIQR